YPDLVFDGMVIGGYAIGSQLGFLYLRGEYRYLYNQLEEYLYSPRKYRKPNCEPIA
ncbi:MAG: [NiFe] hydrogenase diaphorase moiety large subunit, partial [Bacteroidota bacterium]|nr:[NiFe] hydrogenase diaphorase moiety large subunit [Bacteroidota bacterium]